jgi:hypothetical protein
VQRIEAERLHALRLAPDACAQAQPDTHLDR